ncbi:MAG: glucose-6-phosphate dehydrogenase [candidate division KSB1 bacterium]|nr:glucose-6-phosphate dehydrogenase [candidate division KSB1 bacterium]
MKKNPLRDGMRMTRVPGPATLVIFGATGDLTRRKLIPSLYRLYKQNLFSPDLKIIAFARRPKSTAEYREELRQEMQKHLDESDWSDESVQNFLQRIHYFKAAFTTPGDMKDFSVYLDKNTDPVFSKNILFYLATPPSHYETIIKNLGRAGFASEEQGWRRVIIEKPFGHDLASAQTLDRVIRQVFHERQIYRIDHYLGKETVQNLLVFRFANGIFEPIWNRRYVDYVQITVAESIGMEGRGRFYQETGILRDIVQNHMLQLLCLVGMEPPASFDADAVRDEKVKVLRAVEIFSAEQVDEQVVRGQYTKGSLWGESVPGFKQEEDIPDESQTETFVAMRLRLNNWRWAGVPFYLRTGKRLPKRVTEIAIAFRQAPMQIFGKAASETSSNNILALNIQPDEGISLKFASKVPGHDRIIRPVAMDFRYGSSFGHKVPEAYERLLLDAVLGDSTLFTRADESETAWAIVTPLLQRWAQQQQDLPTYPAGAWGPKKSDTLLVQPHHKWRIL